MHIAKIWRHRVRGARQLASQRVAREATEPTGMLMRIIENRRYLCHSLRGAVNIALQLGSADPPPAGVAPTSTAR